MHKRRYCMAVVGGRGAVHARAAGARCCLLSGCEAGVELIEVVRCMAVLAGF